MAGDGVVSVCIPAYQAEAFIGRTLDHAQAQTHVDQRILVAVDASTDATEEICHDRARDDGRIDVIAHDEQQGWAGNVNSLLDRVATEFAFVYFHDDLIDPTYSERLVAALRAHPEAASAHCDVRLFGDGGERIRVGRSYDGSPATRLLIHLLVPQKGSMMRSMIRTSSAAGHLRMTPAGAVFQMALVAAGPVVRVPEVLYHREHQRPTGLGDRARRRPFADVVEGLRWNIGLARDVIEGIHASPTASELLDFGIRVFAESRLRGLEVAHDVPTLTPITEVIPEAGPLEIPDTAATLDDDLRAICESAMNRLHRQNASRAAAVGE